MSVAAVDQHRENARIESRFQLVLRLGIGTLWLIAGMLQFQPLMFTSDFYAWYPPNIMESVIQSTADEQPAFVVALVHAGSTFWSMHPIIFNVCAASVQLVIGLLILFGRGNLRKAGFILSIVWGLSVWVFGESFGDVFGGPNYFDGAPGAAFLYGMSGAVLLYDVLTQKERQSRSILRHLLTLYWFAMALLQILPSNGFWKPGGLMEPIGTASALPQPGFIEAPIEHFSLAITRYYGLINLAIVVIMLVMAMVTLLNLWNKVTITLAFVWLFWSWWFGQDFGALFAGAATDLNSLPVIGLWTAALIAGRRNRILPGREG